MAHTLHGSEQGPQAPQCRAAEVAEWVDALDLGSSAARHGGSSPFLRTRNRFSGMQTSIETLSKLERRLNMAVPAEQIDREVEQRLRKLSRTVRIDGFRPGKVPLQIVAPALGPPGGSGVIGAAAHK